MTPFRRLWIEHGELCCEVRADQRYRLPNPTPEGRRYDPAAVYDRVRAVKTIDLNRWELMR